MNTMKNIILALIILITYSLSNAQNNDIDPRQFITIEEINRQTNEKLEVYAQRRQLLLKLDDNSMINIHFDQEVMAKMRDYYGNVSLAAKINDEAIKVSPYSRVGEKQGKIGINSASPNEISSHLISLIDQLQNLEYNVRLRLEDEFYESTSDSVEEDLRTEYRNIRQSIEILRSYLNYFLKGDTEVLNLFLRLTKLDKLSLIDFENKLNSNFQKMATIDTMSLNYFCKLENTLSVSLKLLMPTITAINSKISNSLSNLGYTPLENNTLRNHDNSLDLKRNIAFEVGELVYQKLFTGCIDLRECRAKEGDILKISVLWYINNDTTTMPLELELASYEIRQVGWRLKVSDSFLLIDRISKPDNEENFSPSNFKGAPGATLMFTYGNNGYNNNLIKRLEPSIGFNVSYLDFYTTQDLEIGVGAVLGILRNQIFFTLGYNLHASTNGEYFGVGFSFANIANQIKKGN